MGYKLALLALAGALALGSLSRGQWIVAAYWIVTAAYWALEIRDQWMREMRRIAEGLTDEDMEE